jgi:hypothetical protein
MPAILIDGTTKLYSFFRDCIPYGSPFRLQRGRRPVWTHIMYGENEKELLSNTMKHGIEVHDYTEEACDQEYVRTRNTFGSL